MRLISLALFSAALCFGLEPDGDAVILYPPPGSVLPGNTVTFTWERSPSHYMYFLSVGSQPNTLTGEIFHGQSFGSSYTVPDIPCNGQTIHVTLQTANSNTPYTATYTAPVNCGPDPHAVIVSPGYLLSASAVFTWTSPPGATGYWLDVGTARGVGDISNGFQNATTRSVSGLPCNLNPNRNVWVRLWTRTANGYLDPVDYTYRAADTCTEPTDAYFTSPSFDSLLPGLTTTFTWTPRPGALDYIIDLGTTYFRGDIWSGTVTGTSVTVTADFCAGSALIFARIYPRFAFGYSGSTGTHFLPPFRCNGSAKGQITTPVPQTVINSSAQFTWSVGVNALDYWLDVGPTQGSGLFSSGVVSGTTKNVTGIPCDGRPVWARLWTRNATGYLQPIDYTYTAATSCTADPRATFLQPAANSTLTAASQVFSWTAGTGALDYWLDVGTSIGIGNIAAGVVRATQIEVFGLPCNGQQLFARLWTRTNAGYLSPVDIPFTATTNCTADPRAKLTAPTPLTTLPATNATFTWSAGAGAQDYWFDFGTQRGSGNLHATLTSGTSITIPAVVCTTQNTQPPCNTQSLWVRLWTRRNGVWLPPIDYEFGRP